MNEIKEINEEWRTFYFNNGTTLTLYHVTKLQKRSGSMVAFYSRRVTSHAHEHVYRWVFVDMDKVVYFEFDGDLVV